MFRGSATDSRRFTTLVGRQNWQPVMGTGVGISQKDLPYTFEAFTQVDLRKKRRHEGAGLGLAIADRSVRLMEEEIQVESELGQGSHFWFDAIRLQRRKQKLNRRPARN